jgi:hypothetical protein
MEYYCFSCFSPVSAGEQYCTKCTHHDGSLKSSEEVCENITVWFHDQNFGLSNEEELRVSKNLMSLLPAWSGKINIPT